MALVEFTLSIRMMRMVLRVVGCRVSFSPGMIVGFSILSLVSLVSLPLCPPSFSLLFSLLLNPLALLSPVPVRLSPYLSLSPSLLLSFWRSSGRKSVPIKGRPLHRDLVRTRSVR